MKLNLALNGKIVMLVSEKLYGFNDIRIGDILLHTGSGHYGYAYKRDPIRQYWETDTSLFIQPYCGLLVIDITASYRQAPYQSKGMGVVIWTGEKYSVLTPALFETGFIAKAGLESIDSNGSFSSSKLFLQTYKF